MDAKDSLSLGSSYGIFSRFVEWCMTTWNPYTEREVQRILQNKIQNRQYGIHLTWQPLPPTTLADEMESLLDTIINISAVPKENQKPDLYKADNCSGTIYTDDGFDLGSLKTNKSHLCECLEEKRDGTSNTHSSLQHQIYERTQFPRKSSNGPDNYSVIDIDFSVSDINLLDKYDVDDLNIDQNSEIWNKSGNSTSNKNTSASKCRYVDVNMNTSANDDDKDTKLKTVIQSNNKSQSNLETAEQTENSNHEDNKEKNNQRAGQRDKKEQKGDEKGGKSDEKERKSHVKEDKSDEEERKGDKKERKSVEKEEKSDEKGGKSDENEGKSHENKGKSHEKEGKSDKKEGKSGVKEGKGNQKEGISDEKVQNGEKKDDVNNGQSVEKPSNSICAEKKKDYREVMEPRNIRVSSKNEEIVTVEISNDASDDARTDMQTKTSLADAHVTKSEKTIETTITSSLTDVVVTSSDQIIEDTNSLTNIHVTGSEETKENAEKSLEVQVTMSEEAKEKTTSLTDVEVPENEKEEICLSYGIGKQKTKSVTWKGSYPSADEHHGDKSSESDSSQTPGPSSYSINPADETSSEEALTDKDFNHLAFGIEGLAHYELFVKIEKKVEIQDINEERHRIRELYNWRIEKINDIKEIAKAYYLNPTGKAVDDWKDLKRGMALERKIKSHTDVKIKLAKLPEFLPFFTIFITLAQLIACGVLCILGGLTTVGIEPLIDHKVGIQTFLGIETVHRWIVPNLWIGPSDKYMITVGAFFAPCLRDDIELHLLTIQQNYSKTEPLGCCEMNSRNTAATTTQYECQDITHGIGVWKPTVKCSERLTGHNSVSHNLKPCCYSNRGQCKLTTHEHCVFLEGYYFKHSKEHCSQVNCLSSVCAMGGFKQKTDQPWLPDNPVQWWRLPLSLIYHHGIIHVVLVGILHFLLMRIMEKSMGWLRIIIVYTLSGMGGNLAASIFEPYSPQVGATGSIFGLLGVTVIEILLLWKFIKSPKLELVKVLFVIIIFLFAGTLRYISNYKIITGLLIGMCSGVLVLPYVTFSKMSRRSRVILVALCIPLILLIYFVLLYIFVKVQTISDCYICKLINCVPYTENICREAHEE